jgi:glycosyltransferase involved in cell wall biosynthesis
MPMRIALVVPGGVDRSGRERVIPALLWLIERLARRHTLHVFALGQYPEPCSYTLLGATVHNLGRVRGAAGLRAARTWRRFWAALQAAGPFDLLHGFWGEVSGLLAAAGARALGVRSVVSLAGGELVALPQIGYGAQLNRRGRLLVGLTLRLANCVTVSSGYMRGLARAHGVQAHEVPLGVEPACFAPNEAGGGPPWRLLHVASLNHVKDQCTLLEALRLAADELAGLHLDIVGEDTLGGAVQERCRALGLQAQVAFHGFLPADALQPFYRRAHLFALPSRHDAAPVVALEAAACAVPTVGTAVGYVSDWSPHCAWAVPVGNAEALAHAIVTLLRDEARRELMGRAAQTWAREHDADWTARTFEALYGRLINTTIVNRKS